MEKRYINLHSFDHTDEDLIAMIKVNRDYGESGAYEIIVDDKFWNNITIVTITFEDEYAEKPVTLTVYGNDYEVKGEGWEPIASALGWECFDDTFLNEYDCNEYQATENLYTWIEDVAEVKVEEEEE